MVTADIGIWIGAILTLFVYSFFVTKGPNILFKFAETTIVGASIGYIIINVLLKNIQALGIAKIQAGEPWYIISLLIGLMIYMRFLPTGQFLAKYPLALVRGVGLGVGVRGVLHARVFTRIQAAANLLVITSDPFANLNNALLLILTILTIYFFYFTGVKKGVLGKVHTAGRYALMLYFGAAFGNTINSRLTMLIARYQFLLYDWLGLAK